MVTFISLIIRLSFHSIRQMFKIISLSFLFLFTFYFLATMGKKVKNGTNFRLVDKLLTKCPDGIRHPLPLAQFPCCCSVTNVPPSAADKADQLAVLCSRANSLEHILSALGPLKQWPNWRLELLRMEHTPIPVLYLDAMRSLPPIRRLHLHNNSLAHVLLLHRPPTSAQSSDIFDSLEELAITSNELSNFGHFSPAISPLRSLRSLSLSANRLIEVPAHIFLHFHSRNRIEQLDLSANSLSDRSIPSEAFLGLGSLQKLSLDKNRMEIVPVRAINELGDSLEELSLGANRIGEIMPTGDGLALPRLKTLNLEANKLSAIDGELFRGIPSLFYLNLSSNRFSGIAPQMFAFIRGLKVLAMNRNPIGRLDSQTFQLVPSLLRLEVAECRIAKIDDDTFGAVPKLQFIHLGDNKMNSIRRHHFAGQLPFLVSLDLGNNLITQIDQFAFANLAQLQALNLAGNRIESLAKNTFDGTFLGSDNLSNAREVNLIGNPLDCRTSDGMRWMREVAEGVMLRGSCEKPTELFGVPLTNKQQLITWWTDQSKGGQAKNALSGTTSASISSASWSSSTWTTTTEMAKTTREGERNGSRAMGMGRDERRTTGSKRQRLKTETAKDEEAGEDEATEEAGSTAEAVGHETQPVAQNCDSDEQRRQRRAHAAVLLLVVLFFVVGVLLTLFLCIRRQLRPFLFALPFRRFSAPRQKNSVAPPANFWGGQCQRRKSAIGKGQHWPNWCPICEDKAIFEGHLQMKHCQNGQRKEWRVSREMFWF